MGRILIAAGASGGHVFPALATAEILRARGHDVQFAGGDRLEAQVIPEAGFLFHALPSKRPPSVRIELVTPRGLVALLSIGRATVKARSLLARLRPDVVLGMGGFASVSVTLAASRALSRRSGREAGRRKIALVLHEQNAHLSLAQRIPSRWADVIALGLPVEEGVTHARVEMVGNPVRASIAALASIDDTARAGARRRLGLDPSTTTLLVSGGSLGSGPLNEAVPRIALPDGVQVLHLAGTGREEEVARAWATRSVSAVVLGFCDAMHDAYAAADVVVSRSGAITVAELSIAGLASVLVPLPTLRRGDQEANARVLERAGGARVVLESDARFADRLAEEVGALLGDAAVRRVASEGARSVARPQAGERLATLVESLVPPI